MKSITCEARSCRISMFFDCAIPSECSKMAEKERKHRNLEVENKLNNYLFSSPHSSLLMQHCLATIQVHSDHDGNALYTYPTVRSQPVGEPASSGRGAQRPSSGAPRLLEPVGHEPSAGPAPRAIQRRSYLHLVLAPNLCANLLRLARGSGPPICVEVVLTHSLAFPVFQFQGVAPASRTSFFRQLSNPGGFQNTPAKKPPPG